MVPQKVRRTKAKLPTANYAGLGRPPIGILRAAGVTSIYAGLRVSVKAVDENSVVVGSARIVLTEAATHAVVTGETDYTGRYEFNGLKPGVYNLRVEREGFYAALLNDLGVIVVESQSG